MEIIVIGAACDELGARHELIRAGRSGGDVQVDITDGEFTVEGALTGQVIPVV